VTADLWSINADPESSPSLILLMDNQGDSHAPTRDNLPMTTMLLHQINAQYLLAVWHWRGVQKPGMLVSFFSQILTLIAKIQIKSELS